MYHRGDGTVGLSTSQPGESHHPGPLPAKRSQMFSHHFGFVPSGAQRVTDTRDFEVRGR